MNTITSETRTGHLFALAAFLAWGLLPIYWKFLHSVSAWEILAHRIWWSLLFVLLILAGRSRWDEIKVVLFAWYKSPILLATSLLLSANWLTYIYAVHTERVLETSLGYYINPLVNVLLGMIFLGERHTGREKGAILLATAGVMYLALDHGHFPWIALVLALTFGFYGLLKKMAPRDSITGLGVETIYVTPFALAYLGYLFSQGELALVSAPPSIQLALVLTGAITALPLIWFAAAARRLTLTTIGFFQYLAPSTAFLLAVFLYHEPFTGRHAVAFGCIWTALILYSQGRRSHQVEDKPLLRAE